MKSQIWTRALILLTFCTAFAAFGVYVLQRSNAASVYGRDFTFSVRKVGQSPQSPHQDGTRYTVDFESKGGYREVTEAPDELVYPISINYEIATNGYQARDISISNTGYIIGSDAELTNPHQFSVEFTATGDCHSSVVVNIRAHNADGLNLISTSTATNIPFGSDCRQNEAVIANPQSASSGSSQTGRNAGEEQGQSQSQGDDGSGATSAKRQTDQPNKLPQTSSQGEREQPKLEPSPFFDGKQFEAGSEPDDAVISTVSNAGQAVTRNWPIAIGSPIVAGIISYAIWRWRQTRQ